MKIRIQQGAQRMLPGLVFALVVAVSAFKAYGYCQTYQNSRSIIDPYWGGAYCGGSGGVCTECGGGGTYCVFDYVCSCEACIDYQE